MELIKKKKRIHVHCIMTNHHVFRMAENTSKMVAVFNHEGGAEKPTEVNLQPSEMFANHKVRKTHYLLCNVV